MCRPVFLFWKGGGGTVWVSGYIRVRIFWFQLRVWDLGLGIEVQGVLQGAAFAVVCALFFFSGGGGEAWW